MNGLDVTFDEDAKVRVLDVEKFKQTEKLEKACKEFVSSKLPALMSLLEAHIAAFRN